MQSVSQVSLRTLNGGTKISKGKDEESLRDFDGRKSEAGKSMRDVDAKSIRDLDAKSTRDLDAKSIRDLDAKSDIMRSTGNLDAKSLRDFDAKSVKSMRDVDAKSTHFDAKSTHFDSKSSHFDAKSTHFDVKSTHFDAKSTHDFDAKSLKSTRDLDAKSEVMKSTRELDRKSESVKPDAVSLKRTDVSKQDSKKGSTGALKEEFNVNASRVSLSTQPVDITKCPICTRDVASPKFLPCLHTFCEVCIGRHAASCLSADKGGQITCPVCTSPVTTARVVSDPQEFAASLPINHFVSSLMVQNFVKQKLCKPCQKAKKHTAAITWCSYCAETLCQEHDTYHRSLTSSDVHHVSTIEEVQNDTLVSYAPGMCKKHDDRLKYYCEFHREPACDTCRKTIHRMCDDLITADRAADGLKNSPETSALLKTLQSADSQTDEIVQGRKENIKELEAGKKKEVQTIAKFREDVNRHLDILEQNLKDELNKKHSQKTRELKREVDTFEMNRSTIAYYKSLLELILKNGSGIQVITELSKVAQQCQILEEKIQHRASKIKRFEFDVKQNDLTSGMESLGTVDFVQTAVAPTPPPEDWHKLRGKKSQAKTHVRENTHDFLVIRYPSSKISGGCTMRSNLLLVDHTGREFRAYNEVGHRDESLTFVFKRSPWDITALPQRDGVDMVAVTMPNECIIEILECGSTPVVEKVHYTTRNNCYGITYVEGQLVVACLNGLEFFELVEDHKLISRSFLRVNAERVQYVHAADKSRIYYSDSANRGSLYCITPDGTEIFEYTHNSLRKPTGISTDSKGNVYVAGYHSNNIHNVSPEGALIHIITPRSKTFYKPTVLIEHDERMYSVFGKHKVIVFT